MLRPLPGSASAGSPFHRGEQRVQERLGVREQVEPWARRALHTRLPEQHRAFYARLPFAVVAARDGADRPWATLLAGEPGFLSSPDPQQLAVGALPGAGDALAGALRSGDDVGLLGIELHSRRRNRANGRVAAREGAGFRLDVEQAFGNCPRHITERSWRRARPEEREEERVRRSHALSQAQRAVIAQADTFFIASGHRGAGEDRAFGMDASHRGGAPGFVRATDAHALVFPDYSGNDLFNTLGNLLADPRAGLLFVDFARGDLLQLSGRARIEWDPPAEERAGGAQRQVHFEVEAVVERAGALPLRWETA